jgi:beta-glucosidase
VNGAYACENHHLLQQILEHEWGFRGYVLADYGAAHVAGPSLVNGLDFEPWPGIAYGPMQVRATLLTGQATMAQVNGHVRRVLRTLFAYGFFDRRAYRDDDGQIDRRAHARTAERIEEAAITLLRNRRAGRRGTRVLPLRAKRLKTVALIGAGAESFPTGGGSSNVKPFRFESPRAAIRKRLPKRVNLRYEDGSDPDRVEAAARGADVAIVIPVDYLTEGADRFCLTLECPNSHGDQDELIRRVAAANRRTVVVLETGGPVLTPWRRRVAALLEAWYSGQDGGTAIARVLFGDADPSGRLPATFPRSESQLPTAGDPERYPGVDNEVYYKEGVLVGYRWYDARRLAPAFPFGFGLSYTRFAYGGLRVRAARGGARVRVHVANLGRRRGADVVQLYLHLPQPSRKVVQPPKQLRGFRRVSLSAHRRRTVTFKLGRRAFAYWDTPGHRWRVAPGCYGVMVGRSSRNIVQRTTIAVGGAACRGASAHVLPHG